MNIIITRPGNKFCIYRIKGIIGLDSVKNETTTTIIIIINSAAVLQNQTQASNDIICLDISFIYSGGCC